MEFIKALLVVWAFWGFMAWCVHTATGKRK